MTEELQRYPVRKAELAHRTLGDEAVVVEFQNSYFFSLNPVGTFIWNHCDGQHSIRQIAAAIAKEYDVSLDEAARDCQDFVESLAEQGLLEINTGGITGS